MQGYQGDDGRLSGADGDLYRPATWCSPMTKATDVCRPFR
jgi:hypothetical protein